MEAEGDMKQRSEQWRGVADAITVFLYSKRGMASLFCLPGAEDQWAAQMKRGDCPPLWKYRSTAGPVLFPGFYLLHGCVQV
jgi:hypothetical protein